MSESKEPGYGQLMGDVQRAFDLSAREARFVMELAADGNASAAYRRAGYRSKSPDAHASRLAVKGSIRAATAHVRTLIAERAGYSAQEALQLTADILRADPRELVEYRRGCCRYCHGKRHFYQRTDGELESDRQKHAANVARRQRSDKEYEDPGFNEQGGAGFDASLDPHPECPDCGGEGIGRVVVKDTRNLSREAAALYAGVRVTKDGVEVRMHDKMVAVDKMFRYHGLYEADNKLSATQAADPAVLAALGEAMERSREQYAALIEKRRQEGFTGD